MTAGGGTATPGPRPRPLPRRTADAPAERAAGTSERPGRTSRGSPWSARLSRWFSLQVHDQSASIQ